MQSKLTLSPGFLATSTPDKSVIARLHGDLLSYSQIPEFPSVYLSRPPKNVSLSVAYLYRRYYIMHCTFCFTKGGAKSSKKNYEGICKFLLIQYIYYHMRKEKLC